MFREDKNYSIHGQHSYKNIQNLPIKFSNKQGILVLTPTLLKYMSLSLKKFKLGFCSDTYLPFGPNSRFLLFFFWRSSLRWLYAIGLCSYSWVDPGCYFVGVQPFCALSNMLTGKKLENHTFLASWKQFVSL